MDNFNSFLDDSLLSKELYFLFEFHSRIWGHSNRELIYNFTVIPLADNEQQISMMENGSIGFFYKNLQWSLQNVNSEHFIKLTFLIGILIGSHPFIICKSKIKTLMNFRPDNVWRESDNEWYYATCLFAEVATGGVL